MKFDTKKLCNGNSILFYIILSFIFHIVFFEVFHTRKIVFYRVHICWSIDRNVQSNRCVVSLQDILRESDISFLPA